MVKLLYECTTTPVFCPVLAVVSVELSTVLAAVFAESGDDVFIATRLVCVVVSTAGDVTI